MEKIQHEPGRGGLPAWCAHALRRSRLLHAAGLLERFYTDLCAQKGWLRSLSLIPPTLQPAAIRRLMGRIVPGVPACRIKSFTGFGLDYVRRLRSAQTPNEIAEIYLWAGRSFSELVLESGLPDIASVYTFNTAGLEVLVYARSRGIKTIMEQTIAPQASELRLLRETARAPS